MPAVAAVRATPGVAGFFFDDQAAVRGGAPSDGFAYGGEPATPGYERVREPGEALLVEVELADGRRARGDCAAVQYSGAGSRDPLFRAREHRAVVEGAVADAVVGREAGDLGATVAALERVADDRDLHTAVRYGVSQALVTAAARARETTTTRALAARLGVTPATEPVPVFGQSGDERYRGAEKMLLKGVSVLPHGLFNSREKWGEDGRGVTEYVEWLVDRVADLGPEEYDPRIHLDVYGMVGDLWGPPYDRAAVVDYFRELCEVAGPYPIQIEGPMDAGGRAEQIRAMAELRDGLADAGVEVDVVADEWCDTRADVRAFVGAEAADVVQVKTPDLGPVTESAGAVLDCRGTDTRAYLGGTCNETATSARTCAHVALATDAAQVLAKPGMGFDEGYMVVTNEMRRALARHRREPEPEPESESESANGDRPNLGATSPDGTHD
ncbi:methylaspartate ammonia-lyase [Halobacteriales archaeon SW_5_70_135]|nr:MAG: methylaspartate ammonia-lyase [Halobacteriales archaeon SW_5_70_135]